MIFYSLCVQYKADNYGRFPKGNYIVLIDLDLLMVVYSSKLLCHAIFNEIV